MIVAESDAASKIKLRSYMVWMIAKSGLGVLLFFHPGVYNYTSNVSTSQAQYTALGPSIRATKHEYEYE